MNPLEIAKEAISIASNAGLKRDVIDLLDKKVGLLAEENIALELSETEVASLKRKVADLEQQLDNLRPKGELADDMLKVLKLFFENDGVTVTQIADTLKMTYGMAEYHCGELEKRGMIAFPTFGMMGVEAPYYIEHKGRQYAVKHGLI